MGNAKPMSRSQNQLATSYAPQSFFTFEGGLGGCMAVATLGEQITLPQSTRDLIFERLSDLGKAWFNLAMAARVSETEGKVVDPAQCVDIALLNTERTDFRLPSESKFIVCRPSRMEYTPAPLSFVCRACRLFKDYESLDHFDRDIQNLQRSKCVKSVDDGCCDWEQLDVIFVHWSGNWEQPFPGQWYWSDKDEKPVKRRSDCTCGGSEFRLNRRSPSIGDWYFECARCDKPLSAKWLQNDKDTLDILRSQNGPERLTDVRMQATPYRASSTYYVKSDLFIDFKDGYQQFFTKLRPGGESELQDFIASQYGFNVKKSTLEDIENACRGKAECANELADYREAERLITQYEQFLSSTGLPSNLNAQMRDSISAHRSHQARVVARLRSSGILLPEVDLPLSIVAEIEHRRSRFAPKFDPVRLSVEHAAFKATKLDIESRANGKKPYVSLTRLDEDLMPDDRSKVDETQNETRTLLDQLGIAEMGLVREFDLCKFSFGYSRMESTPVLTDKRHENMPVRLKLFNSVHHDGVKKNPIYVVNQANEALYVKLNESKVLTWLQELQCQDMFILKSDERIGAGILQSLMPMTPFLDGLVESETPPIYYYVYTLLHSYSHLIMKHVSEYSGLDLSSLGEYIFPADLSFVVYRNGTTMDLGNLSAMWRHSGNAMLRSMLNARSTQCGTGSLCSHRGGACPDCIMVPETSCIASNKLLSRSVIRAVGGRPRFDTRGHSIKGYIQQIET